MSVEGTGAVELSEHEQRQSSNQEKFLQLTARMSKVYERKCSHQLQLFFLPALVLARVAVFLARASRPCSVTLEGSTRLPV